MTQVFIGNLDSRVTARNLEDQFLPFGIIRSIWVARSPPGFAFIEFIDMKGALDAIHDLNGKNGWRVELSYGSKFGRCGRGGEVKDLKCFKYGEPRHFARNCRFSNHSQGQGSERPRSPNPCRSRRSPNYRHGRSAHGKRSPRRRSITRKRRRSYSRPPPYRHSRRDSPYANG